jgi:hypothetical protein
MSQFVLSQSLHFKLVLEKKTFTNIIKCYEVRIMFPSLSYRWMRKEGPCFVVTGVGLHGVTSLLWVEGEWRSQPSASREDPRPSSTKARGLPFLRLTSMGLCLSKQYFSGSPERVLQLESFEWHFYCHASELAIGPFGISGPHHL